MTYFYHTIEATGKLPESLQHVAIALLPRNLDSERPIGLLSVMYRVWAKCRAFLVKRWLKSYSQVATWDYAMPETTVFDSACRQQLLAEVQGWRG